MDADVVCVDPMEDNPQARKALKNAVEEQLQSPESPYVKEAYDRLVKEGIESDEAKKMLGAVLAVEMWEMSVKGREFDEAQYIERLKGLPDMSWLEEEA